MAVKRTRQRPATRRKPATAADVIGAAPRPAGRVPAKWKPHYDLLMRARKHLLNRRNHLAKDAAAEMPTFSLHMADAGTDSFDRDFALSRISSEQDAVYEIDAAIARIRQGAYGICELTGKPIERQRLEAVPWTRFSAAAEKELEKQGVVRRAGLAPRVGVSHRNEAARTGEAEEE